MTGFRRNKMIPLCCLKTLGNEYPVTLLHSPGEMNSQPVNTVKLHVTNIIQHVIFLNLISYSVFMWYFNLAFVMVKLLVSVLCEK